MGWKYLQITYLTQGLHPEYIDNLQNSTIRKHTTQWKSGQTWADTSLLREMQTKLMNYHYMSMEMALKKYKCAEDKEQRSLSSIAGGNLKLCSHPGKQFGSFL